MEGGSELNPGEIEYKGLLAETWDLLRGDTSTWPDRQFYLDIIGRSGEPVLDVGCGTGRLLLDYLKEGLDVDGVDNSPDMLGICRRKAAERGLRPALYRQHMETLDLPRRYRTILIPSSSLQLIVEPANVSQALARLFAHLLPGGSLVASIMILWQEGEPLERTAQREATGSDGITIRRVSRSRYDPETECEQTEDRFQKLVGERVITEEVDRRAPATRSYSQAQIKSLFEKAEFEPVTLYGAFVLRPAKPDERVFVIVGRRPVIPSH